MSKSQNNMPEKKYSKIYVIPYKKNDGWYLYDKRTNECLDGPYRDVSRNREFTLCLDLNKTYCLFKNDQLLCKFDYLRNDEYLVLFEPSFAASFEIIENNSILLFNYVAIYGKKYIEGFRPEILGVLNFQGKKIDHNLTEKDILILKNNSSKDDIKIEDTFWELSENSLYYNNLLIQSFEDCEEINISDFHYGYALVKAIGDVDPELGVASLDIGYIDLDGHYYW